MKKLTRLRLRFILTVPPPPKPWAWHYTWAPYANTYALHRARLIRHRQAHYQTFKHRKRNYYLI